MRVRHALKGCDDDALGWVAFEPIRLPPAHDAAAAVFLDGRRDTRDLGLIVVRIVHFEDLGDVIGGRVALRFYPSDRSDTNCNAYEHRQSQLIIRFS